MINGRQILSIVLQGGLQGSVELGPAPCLDDFAHPLTDMPEHARMSAWAKVAECERRLVVADWAMSATDPVTGKNHVFAEDAVTAVFQSYEAVFQLLKRDLAPSQRLDSWLTGKPSYTLAVRGLRTLRTFMVHVGEAPPHSRLSIPLFPASNEPLVERAWTLPELTAADFTTLDRPKIGSNELPSWNELVRNTPASDILRSALASAREIVLEAESQQGQSGPTSASSRTPGGLP